MEIRKCLLSLLAVLAAFPAGADDNLLIQLRPGGGYRVWHTEGATQISEDDVLAVAVTAKPEGGEFQTTASGKARAFETEQGVVIEMADAPSDRNLLIDRDACGATKIWHSEGPTKLTDDQITELVLSALPEGGRRVTIDGRYAKAYITPLGYAVAIWKAVRR